MTLVFEAPRRSDRTRRGYRGPELRSPLVIRTIRRTDQLSEVNADHLLVSAGSTEPMRVRASLPIATRSPSSSKVRAGPSCSCMAARSNELGQVHQDNVAWSAAPSLARPYGPTRQGAARCNDGSMADKKRRVVIAGAGGRDFHNFNTVFRHDESTEVVAFTAAQIPGIEDR